jgi:AcrR family transcriptional regulator
MNQYKTAVSSKSRAVRHEEHESHGRVLQKRRTRQALLEAANRLRARGTVPTIEDVAAEAQVSRATIYRYYTAIDSLVADALFQADLPEHELFDPTMDTPVDRVLAVERYVNDLLSADEIGLHVIVRNFVDNWLNSDPSDRIPRPGRRLPLLDSALKPFRSRLGSRELRRLRNALALAIGTEALIAMRDVCLLSKREARDTLRWAVTALMHQAFLETQHGTIRSRGEKSR